MRDELSREEVAHLICQLAGRMAPSPIDKAKPENAMINDLNYHPLRLMELAFRLEDVFSLEPITFAESLAMRTVADLQAFITTKLDSRQATIPTCTAAEALLAQFNESGQPPAVPRSNGRKEGAAQHLVLSPLAPAQEFLVLMSRLGPGPALQSQECLALSGLADLDVLDDALSTLFARHGALRTRIVRVLGKHYQTVDPPHPVRARRNDLRTLPASERAAELLRLAASERAVRVDLSKGPVARAAVILLERDLNVLLLTIHHAFSDWWSMQILRHDLGVIYDALLAGREPELPILPVTYSSYAEQESRFIAGAMGRGMLDYWRHQLDGAPPLRIPVSRRQEPARFREELISGELTGDTVRTVRSLTRQHRVSGFMLLFSCFWILLRAWSGQRDFIVFTPMANRMSPELEKVAGCFANNIMLRVSCPDDATFLDLLSQVREVALGAYENQQADLYRVLQSRHKGQAFSGQNLSANYPRVLFQTRLPVAYHRSNSSLYLEAWPEQLGRADFITGTADLEQPVDLQWILTDSGTSVAYAVRYGTTWFDKGTISRMIDKFQSILDAVGEDPRKKVADLINRQ